MNHYELGHCWERLHRANRVLATSPRGLQQRVEGAYTELLGLTPEEFPNADTKKEFEDVKNRLTTVNFTTLSEQDAEDLATKLFDLYGRIQVEQFK